MMMMILGWALDTTLDMARSILVVMKVNDVM